MLIVTSEAEREKIREALVRAIVSMSGEGTCLDAEDHEMLVRYGTGAITYEEMMAFFQQKAARLDAQISRPQ